MRCAARHAGGSRPRAVNPMRRASVTQKRPGAPVPVPVTELLAIYDSDRSCRLSTDVRCLRVFSPASVTCTALYSDDLPCVDTRSTGPRLTPVRSDSIRRGLRPFYPVRSTRLRIFTICTHFTPGSRCFSRTPNSIRHLHSSSCDHHVSIWILRPPTSLPGLLFMIERTHPFLSPRICTYIQSLLTASNSRIQSRARNSARLWSVCLKLISWRTNAGHHCQIWHILPATYRYSLAGGPARRTTVANHNRSP